MDKLAIRDKLLSLEAKELDYVQKSYAEYLHEGTLDHNALHDEDSEAYAVANNELAQSFDHPIHEHQEKITKLNNIDFSAKQQVTEGAVVKFNNRYFVIAVSSSRFEAEGHEFMGISTAAPIFSAMQGLTAGDTFEFNGQQVLLQEVL